MSSNKDERATQIFNSLLKKYIPDNSTFETWYTQPYEDDDVRIEVFAEYSFDNDKTHFWKKDVQYDDEGEPIQYEGTIYLLINKLIAGITEDDKDEWEDVEYYDLPSYVWEDDFNMSVYNKIKPLVKSFNVDVDFDYKFIKKNK
jgi:hypothetical protein